MRITFITMLSMITIACHHDPSVQPALLLAEPLSKGPMLSSCLTYLAEISAKSLKELKIDNDRLQKNPSDKGGPEEYKGPLAAGIYQAKNHNYARAFEILSPLSNKKFIDEGCRMSIRLYSDVLNDLVQLDHDLLAERRQKQELERKIKGLSEIEKDISQRDMRAHGL